ncbi:MAG: hypothetical protein V1806_04275 [Pseudomonadota bacterium]
MDVTQLLHEKMFLGQEFLTWLWFVSEEENSVPVGSGAVGVLLGDRLVASPAQGQEGTRVSVAGREASLAEARQALRRGKLLESLRLGLMVEGEEYWLSLDAITLTVKSMRLPATEHKGAEGLEGLILERVAMIEAAQSALDGLFQRFLDLRMECNGLPLEMRAWAVGKAVAA